jgi:hypothetical protein
MKSVTVHNKCPKIPSSTSMHFAARVRRSPAVRLSWSSRLFMQPAASKMRASNSSGVSTFLQQTSLLSNPTNKNLTKLGLELHIAPSQYPFRIRHMSERFLLSLWRILPPPKIWTVPPVSSCKRCTQVLSNLPSDRSSQRKQKKTHTILTYQHRMKEKPTWCTCCIYLL